MVNNKLVGGFNPETYESPWEGWQPISEMKNKKMFQTTNQL